MARVLSTGIGALERSARKKAQLANYHLRRFRQHLDDADVRQFRRFVLALRDRSPDVLYLGDSAVSLVSPADTDRRPLYEMVADGLAQDLYALHGAGYQPGLFTQYLRALETSECRPLVIVPFCIRLGTLPWNRHPYFARRESIDFLRDVELTAPPRTIRTSFERPTREAYGTHLARSHPTWAGDLTVGEYVTPLKALATNGLDTAAAERLRYAYHHGGLIEQSYLDSVTEMAEALRRLGCRTVAYQTPVPVERGCELFGEPFRELAEQNFELMEKSYRAVLGTQTVVAQTGTICGSDDFIDPADASEHMNERGRRRVAALVVDGVRSTLTAV